MTNKNRRLLGVLLLVVPWAAIIFTLALYSISSFVLSQLNGAQLDSASWSEQGMLNIPYAHAAPLTVVESPQSDEARLAAFRAADDAGLAQFVGNILHVVLGLVGVVALFGILVGTPVGIYLLATTGEEPVETNKPRQPKPLQGQMKAFIFFASIAVILAVVEAVFGAYGLLTQPEAIQSSASGMSALSLQPHSVRDVSLVLIGGTAYVVSAIIYLFWIGRAARNVSLHRKLKNTPEWLTWGHVIPLYNLFHSLITYPSFWNEVSAHKHVSDEVKANGHRLIIAFFILHGLMMVGNQLVPRTSALPSLEFQTWPGVALEVITVASGLAIMTFVHLVTKTLEEKG